MKSLTNFSPVQLNKFLGGSNSNFISQVEYKMSKKVSVSGEVVFFTVASLFKNDHYKVYVHITF